MGALVALGDPDAERGKVVQEEVVQMIVGENDQDIGLARLEILPHRPIGPEDLVA